MPSSSSRPHALPVVQLASALPELAPLRPPSTPPRLTHRAAAPPSPEPADRIHRSSPRPRRRTPPPIAPPATPDARKPTQNSQRPRLRSYLSPPDCRSSPAAQHAQTAPPIASAPASPTQRFRSAQLAAELA